VILYDFFMSSVARWVGALAVVGSTLLASAARADEVAPVASPEATTGAAEIQLKNGGTMRGTIVNVEPGQRVIVIVAGEQSVIPWSEIAKIVGGPKEPAAPAPPPAAPPTPTAPTMGMPLIHIESNWSDLELSRIEGDIGGGFQQQQQGYAGPTTISKYVCRAPCDKLVDGRDGHRFFITGPGMFPAPSFRLDDQDGHVTVRVKGTSLGRFTGGVILVALGGVMGLGGAMFTGASFAIDPEPTMENPNPQEDMRVVRTFGLVTLGLGAAGLIGGILLLSEGHTRIEIVKPTAGNTGVVLDKGVLRF